jgi:hypothetical protein
MKKNETMYLLIGAAVLGYFAFRSGGFLNKSPQLAGQPAVPGSLSPTFQQSAALLPGQVTTQPDPGQFDIIPSLDVTGQQIQFI